MGATESREQAPPGRDWGVWLDEVITQWGLEPRAVRPLPSGDTKQCWLVSTREVGSVVLALHPRSRTLDAVQRERELTWRGAQREVTPEPLATITGSWVELHDDQPVTVSRWVPGTSGYGAPVPAARLQARLHGITLDRTERATLMAPHFAEACAVLSGPTMLPSTVAVPAATLAQTLGGRSWPHALVHGDLHPRNVVVANDSARLLDLDGAGWGVRLFDVVLAAMFFAQRHGHTLDWHPAEFHAYLASYHAAGGPLSAAEQRAVLPMAALAVCAQAAHHTQSVAQGHGDERLLESALTAAAVLLAEPTVADVAPPWEGARGLPLTGGLTAWVDRLSPVD